MNAPARSSLLVGLVGVLVGAALVTNWQNLNRHDSPPAAAPATSIAFAAPLHADDLEQRIIEAVKHAEPSVVLIRATIHGQQINPFDQFFGNSSAQPEPFTMKASGSGFIFKQDGDTAYVATNAHVVYSADKIEVLLASGRKVEAEKIGSDIRSDLAVLKIHGTNLPPALPLGDSNALQQGQFVLAIGEPESFQNSVSLGIVSALHRSDITAGGDGAPIPSIKYGDLLQTTAPINPGNSGGPLITVSGQVVGIAAVVDPRAQNIGFAIPMNVAQPILALLEVHKTISHPYIGIVMTSMDDRISNYLGYTAKNGGVVITNVVTGSPADKAGLAQGDVIIELNHVKVKDPSDVSGAVAKFKTGDKVTLLVWRKGNLTPYDITLADMPEQIPQQ